MRNKYVQLIIFSTLIFIITSIVLHIFDHVFDENFIPLDTYSYFTAGEMLYHHCEPHPIRPLGYSLLSSFPLLLNKNMSIENIIIYNVFINFFLWVGSIIFLYKTLLLFVKKKISFFVTILFVLCVGHIAQVYVYLTETMITFLITLSVFFFFKYQKNDTLKYLIYGSSLLLSTTLIRPGMIYWGLVSVVISIFIILRYKKKIFKLLIPIFISVLLIFSQNYLMYKRYGDFTTSYIDKVTWYYYLGALADSRVDTITYHEEMRIREREMKGKKWSEKSKIIKNDFKEQITKNTRNVISTYITNIFQNVFTGNSIIWKLKKYYNKKIPPFVFSFFYYISFFQNVFFIFLFFLNGIYFIIRLKSMNIVLFLTIGLISYIIITSGISVWQGDRFYLVFYPSILISSLYIYKLKQSNNYDNTKKNDFNL